MEAETYNEPVPIAIDLHRLSLESAYWESVEGKLKGLLPKEWTGATYAHAMGDAALQLNQIDQAILYYQEAIRLNPQLIGVHENIIFLMDAQATTTAESAAAERLRWWNQFGRSRYELRTPHTNVREPEKRLRVGYVSGDFRLHSAGFACHHVIRNHSDQIEPVYYSTIPESSYDTVTKSQWQDHPGFVNVSGHPAAEAARIIQADQIDILVDLSGYTAGNRLLSFTHKPAPIQITAWGYATGAGWPAMDVLFGDALTMAHYPGPERVVNLPSVISFNPRPDLPDVNALPCLERPPVFAVFQRAMKLTRDVLETYAEILRRVPGATLAFKAGDYTQLSRTFIANCMDGVLGQVQFLPPTGQRDHQLYYQHADLSLDPWPQTGGISTLEAAWMGVPTVTLIGQRIIQRASASFMTTLGLPDLVATNTADYIDKSVYLVTDGRQELAAMRARLREDLRQSPIMEGYVDRVEEAYRMLWREYCDRG